MVYEIVLADKGDRALVITSRHRTTAAASCRQRRHRRCSGSSPPAPPAPPNRRCSPGPGRRRGRRSGRTFRYRCKGRRRGCRRRHRRLPPASLPLAVRVVAAGAAGTAIDRRSRNRHGVEHQIVGTVEDAPPSTSPPAPPAPPAPTEFVPPLPPPPPWAIVPPIVVLLIPR